MVDDTQQPDRAYFQHEGAVFSVPADQADTVKEKVPEAEQIEAPKQEPKTLNLEYPDRSTIRKDVKAQAPTPPQTAGEAEQAKKALIDNPSFHLLPWQARAKAMANTLGATDSGYKDQKSYEDWEHAFGSKQLFSAGDQRPNPNLGRTMAATALTFNGQAPSAVKMPAAPELKPVKSLQAEMSPISDNTIAKIESAKSPQQVFSRIAESEAQQPAREQEPSPKQSIAPESRAQSTPIQPLESQAEHKRYLSPSVMPEIIPSSLIGMPLPPIELPKSKKKLKK